MKCRPYMKATYKKKIYKAHKLCNISEYALKSKNNTTRNLYTWRELSGLLKTLSCLSFHVNQKME